VSARAGGNGATLDYREQWRFRRHQSQVRRLLVAAAVAVAALVVGLLWSHRRGPTLRQEAWRVSEPMGSPARLALAGHALVAVWSHGVVKAYHTANGTEVWPQGFRRPYRFEGPPVIAGGSVYFGADDCYLRAVDLATGAPLAGFRAFSSQAPVRMRPCCDGARLYVGTDEGRLYAIDARTGQEQWCWPALDRQGRGPIAGSPARSGNAVVFATGGGELVGLNAVTGGLLWRGEADAGIYSDLTAAEGRIYFGSDGGLAHCWYSGAAGAVWEAWQGADSACYVEGADGAPQLFDPSAGILRPPPPGPGRLPVGLLRHGVALAKGRAYFAGTHGQICCVDAKTGRPFWVRTLPARPTTPITVHRLSLLVGCADNRVVQLNRANGETLASWGLDAKPLDRIWVDDARVYVATVDGVVLALPFTIRP